MDFNEPAGSNVFDDERVVGQRFTRYDGPPKVTGTAPYAYERNDAAPDALYGYPLGAGIGHGRIVSMNADEARNAPGVRAVVTTLDIDPLEKGMNNVARLFGGADVMHYHQAIAVVVAETFEQARAAAAMISVEYEEGEPADLRDERARKPIIVNLKLAEPREQAKLSRQRAGQ